MGGRHTELEVEVEKDTVPVGSGTRERAVNNGR